MTKTPHFERLQSAVAEQCVLGSMIVDSKCIPVVRQIIDISAFTDERHKLIWQTIQTLYDRHGHVDGVLVRAEVENTGAVEAIGGLEYLENILDHIPTAAAHKYYARIVADRKRYRELVSSVHAMQSLCDDPTDVDSQIAQIRDIALGLRPADECRVFSLKDSIGDVAMAAFEPPHGIRTGYRDVDHYIEGLEAGDMCVLAGRPSSGKSAFAINLSLNVAKAGKRVLYFSLEMTGPKIMRRMLSILSGVNYRDMRYNAADSKAARDWWGACSLMAPWPITVVELAWRVADQRSILRRLDGADLVIVDYIGLIDPGQPTHGDTEQASLIARQVKRMAQDEQIPVIAVCQLNRMVESREDHRPRMSDLRSSGEIEQAADFILLLHRDDYYRKQKDPHASDLDGLADLTVAKCKEGPTGACKLVFLDAIGRFADCARSEDANV